MAKKLISFECSRTDTLLIVKICERIEAMCAAQNLEIPNRLDSSMDLTACHANGCALDLQRMLDADDFNIAHDFFGIGRHLDRETGELMNCFLPRFARKEQHLRETATAA